jgi:hypothetical protein
MEKKGRTFLAPPAGNESKDSNWQSLVLYFLSWRNTYGHYDNGSGWLRWVLKQGGAIQAYSPHRDSRCDLGLSFATHAFHSFCHSKLSKEPCS